MPRIERRQAPPTNSRYQSYKQYLRIDFLWRCCYCCIRETEYGGSRHFAVDHFQPKSDVPSLLSVYTNLYYACDSCNGYKSAHWPMQWELDLGFRFFDACVDWAKDHFSLQNDGKLLTKSKCGEYTVLRVRLNRKPLVDLRQKRQEFIRKYRSFLSRRRELSKALEVAAQPDAVDIPDLISAIDFYLAETKAAHFTTTALD